MRKRIQQLANGQFEYAEPILSLSTDKVVIEVLEGRDFTGDFVITSQNHVKMRGMVYSSNPRMECLTPQFEGEEVRIRYQFHSEGLMEGDIQKGEFFIICNQGEYNLSFVASISKLYATTSVGEIRSLDDFVMLAKESWDEAYRLFYSNYFCNLIKQKESAQALLYEGLGKGVASSQNLEEFLIGIHKKKKINFSLNPGRTSFYEVTESRKERVEVRKDQWGYVSIQVSSDAPFLIPDKEHLSNDDFFGSVCPFEYYIREEALHDGKNYGRLTFENAYQKESVEICVSRQEEKKPELKSVHRQIKEAKLALMQLYLSYRFKQIVTGTWATGSVELLNHLMALQPENPMYELMKAQALLMNKQTQEASWILERFKREYEFRDTPVYGYYLYLCTLAEREESYVNRLTNEIESIFRKHPKSDLLFWILLFLKDGYYNNNARKLRAISEWMMEGRVSPYFYIEAYYFIWQEPYLLHSLEEFEIRLLTWAKRYVKMTKDVARQVIALAEKKREYDERLVTLLISCYQVLEDDESLFAICSYLIKGNCYKEKYHKWYRAGIEENLRITGLYEAYLMSMEQRGVTELPSILKRYFQYRCNLPYQYQAVLYVNIIAGKERQPDVYWNYRKVMEHFAMEQIELGHIDDNLAVIYEEMIGTGVLNEELASCLSKILFTHKITCFDERAKRVIIYQKPLKEPQIVTLNKGVAYFALYSNEYVILLEDANQNRYGMSFSYQLERLMKASAYIRKCFELAPGELTYLIYHLENHAVYQQISKEDGLYFGFLLEHDAVREEYKQKIGSKMVALCQNDNCSYNEALETYIQKADYEKLLPEERNQILLLLIKMRRYGEVYERMQQYGYEQMDASARVAVCSYEITELEYEEDDFLLTLVADTYQKGKFNDIMMIYLSKYYNGPTKQMERLYLDACAFEIDTFDLEERILTQMLYTAGYIENAAKIFDAYEAAGGSELVCMAYLSYFSYQYFVKGMVIPDNVFPQIEQRLRREDEVTEACRLALLLHYSEITLTGEQSGYAEQLLSEFMKKNMLFAFYKKFDQRVIQKYQLYDKVIFEYRSKPKRRVMIHFRMEDSKNQFTTEPIKEVYEGIYVKEFIVFFGEHLQYYVTEEWDGKSKITESGTIVNKDIMSEKTHGRYHMLNEMMMLEAFGDDEKLLKQMQEYQQKDRMTETFFTLL